MKLILILILFFVSFNASAGFQTGTSIYQLNVKGVDKSSQQANFNVGYGHIYKDVMFTASTNRLLSNTQYSVSNNPRITTESKAKIDSFSCGYKIQKFVPSLFISFVDLKQKSFTQKLIATRRKRAWVSGISVSYFITKDIYSSFIIVAPNDRLDLKTSTGLALTYLW